MFCLDLVRALEAKRARYLPVGGIAMKLHGVPRMTMDEANLPAFLGAVNDPGLEPVASVKKIESGRQVCLSKIDRTKQGR